MIKTFYKDDIIDRLAAVFTYGINNKYSYKAIEEYIVSSSFINDLENNKYDIESTNEKIVESVFDIKLDKPADISFRAMFFAMSYVNLFFTFNKSFEYLFLYWPLSIFVEKYNIYHEMDFSNLKADFKLSTSKTTLIKKLSIAKNIKYTEIAKLTGINLNTINKYSRSDKYLYAASHDIVYKLAILFNVKENIFVSNLYVYLDKTIYLFDRANKKYMDYLGLFFAGYFDKRIGEINFKYNDKEGYFISSSGDVKLIVMGRSEKEVNIEEINKIVDMNTYIVFFYSSGDKDYKYLKSINAMDVMVVTQENTYIIKKERMEEITDTINRSLMIRAMSSSL